MDLLNVVAVFDVEHVPAKRVKLGGKALAVAHDIGARTVKLPLVVVHQAYQIIQFIMRRELCRFPNLPFVGFAVADGHKNTVPAPLRPAAERRADRFAHALPQRAGGQVYANRLVPVGTSFYQRRCSGTKFSVPPRLQERKRYYSAFFWP